MRVVVSVFFFVVLAVCRFSAAASARAVEPQKLANEIAARVSRVHEFVTIRKLAEERGLKVWLFGGTAAAFAHYVKWDLLREAGDNRYQANRFDYDFTNIFRSTQDLDIVVDGGADKVYEFQYALKGQFPYFMGSKDQWEVRSLREKVGDKDALLNNRDFLSQHTDSNSTGMIELTANGETRDLRDWEAPEPQFLKDVAEGKLHYYFSEKHETTSRYLDGKNPPILSVVRYLTKAFQFELEMRSEDLAAIEKVITEFNPKSGLQYYVRDWLEKNAPKLVRHAVDVEYAWNTLEKLGLRQKLIALSHPEVSGSLGWWLNKEPLRSLPVGLGSGRTIRELAEEREIPLDQFVVAHETSDFLAYESLTRNTTGAPNVFISRVGGVGEMAAYGNGHYTQIGRSGAKGTGLTVRYVPNPDAREGTDFIVSGEYIVWRNRNALRVIPESLNFGILEYFKFLSANSDISPDDRGIMEKLRRRIGNQLHLVKTFSSEQLGQMAQVVSAELDKAQPNRELLRLWFSLEQSQSRVDLIRKMPKIVLADIMRERPTFEFLKLWFELNQSSENFEVFKSVIHALTPLKGSTPFIVSPPEFWTQLFEYLGRKSWSTGQMAAKTEFEYRRLLSNPGGETPWGVRLEAFKALERNQAPFLKEARDEFVTTVLLEVRERGEHLNEWDQNQRKNPSVALAQILALHEMGVEVPLDILGGLLVLGVRSPVFGELPWIPFPDVLERATRALVLLVTPKDESAVVALEKLAYQSKYYDEVSKTALLKLHQMGLLIPSAEKLKKAWLEPTGLLLDDQPRMLHFETWKTFIKLGSEYREAFGQAISEVLRENLKPKGYHHEMKDRDRIANVALFLVNGIEFRSDSLDHTIASYLYELRPWPFEFNPGTFRTGDMYDCFVGSTEYLLKNGLFDEAAFSYFTENMNGWLWALRHRKSVAKTWKFKASTDRHFLKTLQAISKLKSKDDSIQAHYVVIANEVLEKAENESPFGNCARLLLQRTAL
jgi:hypothetical protein